MKFYGNIGFVKTIEQEAGMYHPYVSVKPYRGDVNRNIRRVKSGESINDDIVLNNEISIVADSFATENLGYMRYVEWLGQKWKIESAEIVYPRIILTLGGVYNAAPN